VAFTRALQSGAVLLAAGEASRMGGRPKPLLELGGVPLIPAQPGSAVRRRGRRVVVVLGHRADEIEPAVRDFPITLVWNPGYVQGQASSVRAGLAALSSRLDAIVVALADMPLITAEDVTELLGAYKAARARSMLVPFVEGERAQSGRARCAVRDDVLAGDLNSDAGNGSSAIRPGGALRCRQRPLPRRPRHAGGSGPIRAPLRTRAAMAGQASLDMQSGSDKAEHSWTPSCFEVASSLKQGARGLRACDRDGDAGFRLCQAVVESLDRCPRATADGLGGWRLRRIGCLQGRVGVLGDRGGDDRRHRSERRGAWGWNALRRTHAGFRRSGAPAAATLADGPCPYREALCTLADLLGFDVIVDDGGATWQRYVAAKRLITDDLDYSQLAPLQTTSSSSRPNTRATTNRSSALWPPRPDTSR